MLVFIWGTTAGFMQRTALTFRSTEDIDVLSTIALLGSPESTGLTYSKWVLVNVQFVGSCSETLWFLYLQNNRCLTWQYWGRTLWKFRENNSMIPCNVPIRKKPFATSFIERSLCYLLISLDLHLIPLEFCVNIEFVDGQIRLARMWNQEGKWGAVDMEYVNKMDSVLKISSEVTNIDCAESIWKAAVRFMQHWPCNSEWRAFSICFAFDRPQSSCWA